MTCNHTWEIDYRFGDQKFRTCQHCFVSQPLSELNIGEEKVEHPKHYGGADNTYEVIKVIEAWGLGFHLGNVVKYVARAGLKGDKFEDLAKAKWYLEREINNLLRERDEKVGAIAGVGGYVDGSAGSGKPLNLWNIE